MTKHRFVLRKLAVGLVSLSLGASVLPQVSGANTSLALAEEVTTSPSRGSAISEVTAKRDEVLNKLHELIGSNEADSKFFRDIIGNKKYANLANPHLDTDIESKKDVTLRRLDTELFRLDLFKQAVDNMNSFFERHGIADRLTYADVYMERKEVSEPLPRYSFELKHDIGKSKALFYFIWLLWPSTYDENELLENKKHIDNLISGLEPRVEAIKTSQQKYNEVISYFNSQPEDIRKEQFDAFAYEMVQDISYSVDNGYNFEKIVTLEERIKAFASDDSENTTPETPQTGETTGSEKDPEQPKQPETKPEEPKSTDETDTGKDKEGSTQPETKPETPQTGETTGSEKEPEQPKQPETKPEEPKSTDETNTGKDKETSDKDKGDKSGETGTRGSDKTGDKEKNTQESKTPTDQTKSETSGNKTTTTTVTTQGQKATDTSSKMPTKEDKKVSDTKSTTSTSTTSKGTKTSKTQLPKTGDTNTVWLSLAILPMMLGLSYLIGRKKAD